jgi:NaMN:DMB phosphoribosyltransferase
MSTAQAQELLLETIRYTREQAADGVQLFGVGELGMANTTPAAAIVSVLTGEAPESVVGIGANLPESQLGHKAQVVRRAIEVNQPDANNGLDVLAKVGGFDLLGMTGVMIGAASCGLPVVLDGFLSYASALAACRIEPKVKDYLIPSHLSAEKGARIALQNLGLEPYLNMGMRLGEGSGAALAMQLVDAACAMHNKMGTLANSNIVLPERSKMSPRERYMNVPSLRGEGLTFPPASPATTYPAAQENGRPDLPCATKSYSPAPADAARPRRCRAARASDGSWWTLPHPPGATHCSSTHCHRRAA